MKHKTKKPRKQKRKHKKLRVTSDLTKTSTKISKTLGLLSRIKSGWKGIVVLSVIASLFGFIFVVYPRLEIEAGEPITQHNPFHNPLVLRNNGYLPVRDIHLTCVLKDIHTDYPKDMRILESELTITKTIVPKLSASESASIKLQNVLGESVKVNSADIEVVIRYRPYLLPVELEKTQRFTTVRTYEDVLRWTPQALSK